MNATSVDLTPILTQIVIPIAGAVLSGLVPYVVYKLSVLLKLKSDDATRAYLQQAAVGAVKAAVNEATAAAGKIPPVDLHNKILAEAVTALNQNAPDAIKKLGLTPDAVENLVSARLGANGGGVGVSA